MRRSAISGCSAGGEADHDCTKERRVDERSDNGSVAPLPINRRRTCTAWKLPCIVKICRLSLVRRPTTIKSSEICYVQQDAETFGYMFTLSKYISVHSTPACCILSMSTPATQSDAYFRLCCDNLESSTEPIFPSLYVRVSNCGTRYDTLHKINVCSICSSHCVEKYCNDRCTVRNLGQFLEPLQVKQWAVGTPTVRVAGSVVSQQKSLLGTALAQNGIRGFHANFGVDKNPSSTLLFDSLCTCLCVTLHYKYFGSFIFLLAFALIFCLNTSFPSSPRYLVLEPQLPLSRLGWMKRLDGHPYSLAMMNGFGDQLRCVRNEL